MNRETIKEILSLVIEYHELREENPYDQDMYLPNFPEEVELDEEQEKAFEAFINEFLQESWCEQEFFYLCGLKDGLKMLMMVDSVELGEEILFA